MMKTESRAGGGGGHKQYAFLCFTGLHCPRSIFLCHQLLLTSFKDICYRLEVLHSSRQWNQKVLKLTWLQFPFPTLDEKSRGGKRCMASSGWERVGHLSHSFHPHDSSQACYTQNHGRNEKSISPVSEQQRFDQWQVFDFNASFLLLDLHTVIFFGCLLFSEVVGINSHVASNKTR